MTAVDNTDGMDRLSLNLDGIGKKPTLSGADGGIDSKMLEKPIKRRLRFEKVPVNRKPQGLYELFGSKRLVSLALYENYPCSRRDKKI
jgi:hypothetical protein